MFDITLIERTVVRNNGETWSTKSYVLIYKRTGEIHYPKTRKYGYSDYKDCVRARTRLFNDYMKSLEENLLGKEVR